MPKPALAKYIDRFYFFEKVSDSYFELPPVVAGTGLELVFHSLKPLAVNGQLLPQGHTVCPRKMFCFDPVTDCAFLSVRFKSGAFRHFSPRAFSALNDKYISPETLWGTKGSELIQELAKQPDIPKKIRLIETFLDEAFHQHHHSKNDKWDAIIDQLYYNHQTLRIEALAASAQLSLRQFERGFKQQFGLTAKEFQQLCRFQQTVKNVLLQKKPNYLATALECGYYDQSHFIKYCRNNLAMKPSELFEETLFETHFFHKSI